MANMFFADVPYPIPEMEVVHQAVERVLQVTPYRRFERDRGREDDPGRERRKFAQVLEEETNRRRYETGDVSQVSEIGDPGFFFDYRM